MSDPRHALGRAAEDATATWLARCGWHVILRRHRSPAGGEVDLVAVDPAGTLVAIEVRARRTARTGGAAWSVDQRRVARLRRTLASVGASCGEPHDGLRVDLVIVEPLASDPARWRIARIPGVG